MIRKILWAVLVVGLLLIIAPLVMGLPDKADGGQQMIDGLAPIMDGQLVRTTADDVEPLVTTMQEQRANYRKIAGLPDLTLFAWFFLIPGVVLVGLAITGLYLGPQREHADVDDASFVTAA